MMPQGQSETRAIYTAGQGNGGVTNQELDTGESNSETGGKSQDTNKVSRFSNKTENTQTHDPEPNTCNLEPFRFQ